MALVRRGTASPVGQMASVACRLQRSFHGSNGPVMLHRISGANVRQVFPQASPCSPSHLRTDRRRTSTNARRGRALQEMQELKEEAKQDAVPEGKFATRQAPALCQLSHGFRSSSVATLPAFSCSIDAPTGFSRQQPDPLFPHPMARPITFMLPLCYSDEVGVGFPPHRRVDSEVPRPSAKGPECTHCGVWR